MSSEITTNRTRRYITTPKQAIDHLSIRLTGKDLEALRVLAREIEMMNHKDKKHHWLFAKLFLSVFENVLLRSESSLYALDSIRFALNKPMEDHFKAIHSDFETLKNVRAFESEDLESVTKESIQMEDLKKVLIEKINISLNDEKNYG